MRFQSRLATPFSLHSGGAGTGLLARAAATAAPLIDPLLGLSALDRLYDALPGGNFIDEALERLGITVEANPDELRQVPETGATIVIANHPTGAMDGLALAQTLLRRRGDVRLLGNHLIARVPEMRRWTITINPFDPRSLESRRGVRAATNWLKSGGLLIVFPAGAVSNDARAGGRLVDGAWQPGVLRLARWSGAAIVPAFVEARSSRWFRLAGLIHPGLRTALLPRELLRLRNQRVRIRLAAPVEPARLAVMPGRAAPLAYLRARTYALEPGRAAVPVHDDEGRSRGVVSSVCPSRLRQEIAALAPEHELIRSGDLSVYCASAELVPTVLREIGRLREVTFRVVGEGTGRPIDLDEFDRRYQHLFVWHRGRLEIVGAYRVGATDRLCGRAGPKALYSSTLFRIAPAFLAETGPALELGRSFVRPEYQREPAALFLLWRGIGALVAREPRYRRLFGPVSISASYSRPARQLLAGFLARAGDDPAWGRHVRPRHPLPEDSHLAAFSPGVDADLKTVDGLIREMEDGRGVPVLVRQYWKLGARFLGFSVDPDFGDALDGLTLVDLAAVPPLVLQKYLGREGAAAFRFHHGLD